MISVLLFIFSPTIASNRFFGFRRIEKRLSEKRSKWTQPKLCSQQYPHFFLDADWWIKRDEPVGITFLSRTNLLEDKNVLQFMEGFWGTHFYRNNILADSEYLQTADPKRILISLKQFRDWSIERFYL